MKMVLAIVRTTSINHIVEALQGIGVHGLTMFPVQGIGEQVTLNTPYSQHHRIEVFVPDTAAHGVTAAVLAHARTGLAGDGLLAVLPVDSLIKIRTCESLSDATCSAL